jgi:hypothetical protein
MTDNRDAPRAWMVRTKDMYLSRPMSEPELIKKIERGDFSPLDEICPGTGYWFGLHEADEVRRYLGNIDLSKLSTGIEVEITSSTETRSLNRTLILEMPKRVETPVSSSGSDEASGSPVETSSRSASSQSHAFVQPESNNEIHWTTLLAYLFGFLILLVYLWSWSV